MQHTINPDGTRNREFRPYIYAEETTYDTSLYDPFRSVNYGLYKYGVYPPAIPSQLDVLEYAQRLDTPDHKFPPPRSYYNYRDIRDVYLPNTNTNGQSTMYKQLYAL